MGSNSTGDETKKPHRDGNAALTDTWLGTEPRPDGSFRIPDIKTVFYTRLLRIRKWDDRIVPRFRLTLQVHPLGPGGSWIPRLDLDIWRHDVTVKWVKEWEKGVMDWRGRRRD